MKNSLIKAFIMVGGIFSLCAACEPEEAPEPNYIEVVKKTTTHLMFGYYIGEDKNFIINADYVFNKHPEYILTIPWSSAVIRYGVPHDGKERDRTYQFIFFDGETLGKYTLSEIAELNIYDDLQILTFDELRAANYTVTYSGPKIHE